MPYPDYTDDELLEMLTKQGVRNSAPGEPIVQQLGPRVTQLPSKPSVEVGPITQPMRPRPEIGEARMLPQRPPPQVGIGDARMLEPDPELTPAPQQPRPQLAAPDDEALDQLAAPQAMQYTAPRIREDRPPEQLPEDNLGVAPVPKLGSMPAWDSDQEALSSLIPKPPTMQGPKAAPESLGRESFVPRAATPATEMAGKIEAPDPNGGRPHMYGHNDNTEYDWRKNANAAGEAALAKQRAMPPQQSDDRALQSLISDADIQRAWRANTMYGQRGDNIAVANMQTGRMNREQAQAHKDRREDEAHGRMVDPGTAWMMGAAGASPDVASNTPSDVPWAASLPNVATMGVNDKRADLRHQEHATGELGKDYRQENALESKERTAALSADTQIEQARIHAASRANGGTDPEQARGALSSYLYQRVPNVTPEQARRFAETGEPLEELSDRQNGLLWASAKNYSSMAPKSQDMSLRSAETSQGSVADSAERQRQNPQQRLKVRQEVESVELPLKAAAQGWKVLASRPDVLDRYVKLGAAGMLKDFNDATLRPEEQVAIGRLTSVLGKYAFSQGGKALTGPERGILGAAQGVKLGGGPALFQSPAVLADFLQNMGKAVKSHKQNIALEYGDPYFWSQ